MARREIIRLVTRCLEGREDAWEEFLQRYARLIWATAQRSGASPEEAEEIFQRSWVVIVEGLGKLKNREALVGWIVSITRNQTLRLIEESRRHRRRIDRENMDEDQEAGNPQEADLLRRESSVLLHRAMDGLSDRCRKLLTCLFLTEPRPDYEEIAEVTGLAVGSIGPIRARCLARLRKNYLKLYQAEEKEDS